MERSATTLRAALYSFARFSTSFSSARRKSFQVWILDAIFESVAST